MTRLNAYHFKFEHRERTKHQNADGLSKRTNEYRKAEEPIPVKEGFNFMSENDFEKILLLEEGVQKKQIAAEVS